MNLLIATYIIWLIIGLVSIWFSYNWIGRENIEEDAVFAGIIASIMSGLVLWPSIVIGIFWQNIKVKEFHPLKALNKPMKYIVDEIKNPRSNI